MRLALAISVAAAGATDCSGSGQNAYRKQKMNRREDCCPQYGDEQQPEPTSEAGCKSEVNRNVQGTDLRSGFAELRSRAFQARSEANKWMRQANALADGNFGARSAARYWAFDQVLEWLDELEADAKSGS